MRLNTIRPARGSKPTPKRLGRGIGSGLGKTSGKGHKGQRARAGGYHKVGFEGGQMPIQRRLPKRGFRSKLAADTAEVRLGALAKLDASIIDLAVLKQAGVIPDSVSKARVFLSGTLTKAVTLRGLHVTKGARDAIAQVGGKVEE